MGDVKVRESEVGEVVNQYSVQNSMYKGDGILFNPAIVHAAGSNTTNDFHRRGNLLQISSAFGKTMEHIDYIKIISHIYPYLLNHKTLSERLIENVLICATDGYAFPTNLDSDKNSDSKLQSMSMFELTKQSLLDSVSSKKFNSKLLEHQQVRLAG